MGWMAKRCLVAAAAACVSGGSVAGQITNGGFDTGDLTGWTFTTGPGLGGFQPTPFEDGLVSGIFGPSIAIDGGFSFAVGFQPGIQLFQDVAVDGDGMTLTTNHRIRFAPFPVPAPSDPVFSITVRDGSNAIVGTLYEETIVIEGLPGVAVDLGYQELMHDLSPYAGQAVRISFDLTGPSGAPILVLLELDAISADGTACDGMTCPTLIGSCCLPDATCEMTNQIACEAADGLFSIGSDCASVLCADRTGACCLPGDSCEQLSTGFCELQGGTFSGLGTDCDIDGCDRPANDYCTQAEMLTMLPALVDGSTELATFDLAAPLCADDVGLVFPGPSVWYAVQGTGTELVATTCADDMMPGSAEVDTQIVVYTGVCGGLFCAGASNDGCSDTASTARFCTSADQMYYIRVASTTPGAFGLSVYDASSVCDALSACCLPDGTCVTVNDEAVCMSGGGAWQGELSNCAEAACPDLRGACCAIDGTCTVVFEQDCLNAGSVFAGMGVDCGAAACMVDIASNDDCETAEPITTLPALVAGDTRRSLSPDQLGDCGDGSDGTRGGLWYTVVGTGNELIATTCEAAAFPGSTATDSMLRVYTGGCADPVCVGGNDDGCSSPFARAASTVAWESEAGVTYRILVSGWMASFGAFELSVFENSTVPCCFPDATCMELNAGDCAAMGGVANTDATDCASAVCPDLRPPNDFCDGAEVIDWPAVVPGDTSTATSDDAPTCGDVVSEHRGVWYSVTGTGRELMATTCSLLVAQPGRTTFPMRFSVYQSCGELVCVDAVPSPCAFGTGSSVTFCADEDETYLIHLHADTPTLAGVFDLSVFPTGVRCSGCVCEYGGDPETVDIEDVLTYVALWLANDLEADIDGGTLASEVQISDLLLFLDCYFDSIANGGTCE